MVLSQTPRTSSFAESLGPTAKGRGSGHKPHSGRTECPRGERRVRAHEPSKGEMIQCLTPEQDD